MKIVFHSGLGDKQELKAHALRPSGQKIVQERAKDPDDELELLIVHSMLLTGYDAPPIHTLYMDRPMRGANLMQALARVNRRFRGKQDGLLVGYAPLTENLRKALAEYSPGDQQDQTLGRDIERAITEVRNEHTTICGLLSGIPWRALLAELVAMAKEVSAEARRGERFDPPLNHAELAFYDAVANHGLAKALMGDDTLAQIARALVADIRKNLTVDWLSREPVRAKLRNRIRRLLTRFDYPPDEERAAVDLVLKQMETFATEWAPTA